MQAYRDMTVYPETDDEADRNRREISRGSPCRACNNKVNGVGGLHSGLQARAQVICCGATNTVASQGTLLPSLIAVPAGYFFVASPPASHQDTSSDSVHAAEAVSVHYLPTGVYLLAAANSKCRVALCKVVCDSCQSTSWAHPIHVSCGPETGDVPFLFDYPQEPIPPTGSRPRPGLAEAARRATAAVAVFQWQHTQPGARTSGPGGSGEVPRQEQPDEHYKP